MRILLFIFLTIFTLPGCKLILSNLYGVHKLERFDEEKYNSFISSIDHDNIVIKSFYANEDCYNKIRHLSEDSLLIKTFSQPIQILYFDKKNKLVSIQANCYAKGGITNLKWNTDNRFNEFIPISAINIKSFGFNLKDFSKNYTNNKIIPSQKYTVIIYWTLMLEKISRSAIRTVIDNIQKFDESNNVVIYLINNDDAFIGAFEPQ